MEHRVGKHVIHVGKMEHLLPTLEPDSIDACVTDPPYELGFMGKSWDRSGVAFDPETWAAVYRVLKPGAYLLAFGGTRTVHRIACAIEDSGFEIRDQIAWMFGSGFPKSLDVSKAIDKRGGVVPWQADFARHLRDIKPKGLTADAINKHVGNGSKSNFWGHFIDISSQPLLPTIEQYRRLRDLLPIDQSWDALFLPEAEREVIGQASSGIGTAFDHANGTWAQGKAETFDITAPATDLARQWDGWGTALKPAYEPIIVARKPLVGTVAQNVTTYGTGAINVDACRIGTGGQLKWAEPRDMGYHGGTDAGPVEATANVLGRWPSNVCLDEDAAAALDAMSGERPGMQRGKLRRGATTGTSIGGNGVYGTADAHEVLTGYGDTGGASRFFYVAKASRDERGPGNTHPTVKPVDLMRWLVRLVTPPGGTVLDPFAGSGSTGLAAEQEGFTFVGIELSEEYAATAARRLEASAPLFLGVS